MPVAILIVNYKAYDDLARCLASLNSELRSGDEVIVVDQECDPAQMGRIQSDYPGVTTIALAGNVGFAAGVNRAARASQASLLWLLNPDSVVESGALAVLEEWLSTHPRAAVVGPRVLNRDGTIQPSARRFPGLSTLFGGRSTWLTRQFPNNWWSRANLLGLAADGPVDVDWLSGSSLMTRREVFDCVGGFDESFFLYWEDADFCRRATIAGQVCTYIPWVAVRHFGGGSAKFDLPRAIRSFHASAYRLFRKHAGWRGRLVAPLIGAGLYLRGEFRLWQALRETPSERSMDVLAHGWVDLAEPRPAANHPVPEG